MKKILDFGSLNYDYVYSVDHATAPGETISSKEMNTFFGGKGLNQAIALARAGAPVWLAGQVGEDGADFLSLCAENGVDSTYIRSVPGKSGHAIIQVDKNAQNCILLYGGSNRSIQRDFIDSVIENFEEGDLILLQNEISELDYVIEKAHEHGLKIALNPSPFDYEIGKCDLNKISVFLVNEIEGAQITGEKDPEKILQSMSKKFPHATTVLTLGGDGAVCRDKDNVYRQPIYPVKAVDTTAAGDTFTGYFLASQIRGESIPESLEISAKAAAIAVTREGATTSIPVFDEVSAYF